VAAHFRDPHVEAQARQVSAQAHAFGENQKRRLEKLPCNKMTGTPRGAVSSAMPKRVTAISTVPVGAVAGFESIDIFAQIAATFGADQGDRKQVAAALHNALAQKRAASGGARPT
jgi:hypothetical protein